MGLNLPNPDTSRLPRSPLELVICQIRFDRRLRVGEAPTALAFHEDLGGPSGRYQQLDEIEGQQLVISAGPGVEQTSQSRKTSGWKFSSENGEWIVTLMPDHVALETTAYTTWDDDFGPRLSEVVKATAKHIEPTMEQRLGLRYVDRISELKLTSIREWSDYIAPELLGLVLHPAIGPEIVNLGQQLLIGVDDQVQAGVRHGPVVDAESDYVDYLLDYDLFRQGGRPFEVESVLKTVSQLNRYALQLFHASATEKLLEFLRGQA
jgi:uncharacterized protein (TIGR04255 family)